MHNGGSVKIIITGLTKIQAIDKETEFIELYKDTCINLRPGFRCQNIIYNDLKNYFILSEESPTGLIWKINIGSRVKAGSVAGSIDVEGYYRVGLKGRYFKCHRIVWCLKHEKDLNPLLVIDHLDGNKSNNRYNNLEIVTVAENNKRCREASVNYDKNKGVFRFAIRVDDKTIEKSFSVSKYGYEEARFLAEEELAAIRSL